MKLSMSLFWIAATASVSVAEATGALDAYRDGNYEQAARVLLDAKDKDPFITYYLAKMHLYGYGALKNDALALRYFKQAANNGILPAQNFLARYALIKENNLEEALYWFKKAASANDVRAQMYTAAAYLFGIGAKQNTDLALRFIIEAAKKGNSTAQYTLAQHFLDSGHAANKTLGMLWLNKSVAQENPMAQLLLGQLYAEGRGVVRDADKAKTMIGLASAQRYLPAMLQMSVMARDSGDFNLAKEWLQQAVERENTAALIALAQLYLDPKSPFTNPQTGFSWMLKAANLGSSAAQSAVASMYKDGVGVSADAKLMQEWHDKALQSAKETADTARVKAAQWLSMGRATTFAGSGYALEGIVTRWTNKDAIKENIYNQPPILERLSQDAIYKPQFVLRAPKTIPLNDYYDALVATIKEGKDKQLTLPRYVSTESGPLDFKILRREAALGEPAAQFILAGMYEQGATNVDKNPAEALKYYQLAAAQQDLRAEYNLALMLLQGNGVNVDYVRAMALLKDAAIKGVVMAQYAVARIYEYGYKDATGNVVIPADAEQSLSMYYLAAEGNYGPAEYRLADKLLHMPAKDFTVAEKTAQQQLIKELLQNAVGRGVVEAEVPLAFYNAMDANVDKQAAAYQVAKKAADANDTDAAMLLAILYDRGIGVTADLDEAISWYKKAANNPVSAFILGTYMCTGNGMSKDLAQGQVLLEQAAHAGFSYASLNLGILKHQRGEPFLADLETSMTAGNSLAANLLADYYLTANGNEEQRQLARDLYQKLADKGDATGQLKLAYMQEHGLGGAIDREGAQKWYTTAAETGLPPAQFLLAHFYQMGTNGAQPDYLAATNWLVKAQTKYAPAAVALGFIQDTVYNDYKNAEKSYAIAATQNNAIGQFDLGLLYEKGKGRAVDFMKAKELYEKAADAGLREAMVQLAALYFNGSFGDRDEDRAVELYKKAAALGSRDAQYQLGLLSETGVVERPDLKLAIKNYTLAADKGDTKAILALARMYQFGLGVTKDAAHAEKLYLILVPEENAYAQYQLATLYYNGINGVKNIAKSRELLQRAQSNGSQQAMKMLQLLDAETSAQLSFIEPIVQEHAFIKVSISAELTYLDALNAWDCGDEELSRTLLSYIMKEFPEYAPARHAYLQMKPSVLERA